MGSNFSNYCRAKSKQGGKWVYGYYVKHIDATPCYFNSDTECDAWYKEHTKHLILHDGDSDWWMSRKLEGVEIDETTLGPAVGIKDVMGISIFDGDIIKFHNQFNFPVMYFENRFVLYADERFWTDLCANQSEHYLIVGNIYDNPELVSKGVGIETNIKVK